MKVVKLGCLGGALLLWTVAGHGEVSEPAAVDVIVEGEANERAATIEPPGPIDLNQAVPTVPEAPVPAPEEDAEDEPVAERTHGLRVAHEAVKSWLNEPLAPERQGFRVALGLGAMLGDSTFEIGGKVSMADGTSAHIHFPLSRLEYPLDVVMATLEGSYEFGGRWSITGKAGKNLTTDSGKTKDSDFGIFFHPGSLDIYSESDTKLDALVLEAQLRYKIAARGRWAVSAGLGYAYQHFDMEVSNLVQEYPSLRWLGAAPDIVDGKVAEYNVTYHVPYLDVAGRLRVRDHLTLDARIGYAPYVVARDEGNWLLRSKTFDSDCDGDALLLSLRARMDFRDRWFAALSLDRKVISTDGTLEAYFDGVYDHKIDKTTESQQTHVNILLGMIF